MLATLYVTGGNENCDEGGEDDDAAVVTSDGLLVVGEGGHGAAGRQVPQFHSRVVTGGGVNTWPIGDFSAVLPILVRSLHVTWP